MANYTKLNLTAGEALLSGYGFELRSMESISGGAMNSSYLVKYRDRFGEKSKAVLTVLDSSTVEDAHNLSVLLYSLIDCNVPIEGIIQTNSGDLTVDLRGKSVILRPFVEGIHPDALTPDHFMQLGTMMGNFRRGTAVALEPLGERWATRRIPSGWRQQLGTEPDPDLYKVLEIAELLPITGAWHLLPQSLCHGDLFPDNIIRKKSGKYIALDWELASLDSPVLDIGIAFAGSWEAIENRDWSEIVAEFCEGYQKPYTLTEAERQQIYPATLYGLALLAFRRNWVSRVLGMGPALEWDWHTELVDRFHNLSEMQR